MSDTTPTAEAEATKPAAPFLTIVSGNPDDTQVAALTVLFAGMASAAAAAAETQERERNMWGTFAEKHHSNIAYNPSAFRNVEFY